MSSTRLVVAAAVLSSGLLAATNGRALPAQSGQAPGVAATQTDWPQWRGPNRNGAVAAFIPPTRWPDQLTARWKVDVGLGYA